MNKQKCKRFFKKMIISTIKNNNNNNINIIKNRIIFIII